VRARQEKGAWVSGERTTERVGVGSRKGVGRVEEWPGNARHGRIHGAERGREVRDGEVADRWGPRVSEGANVNGRSVLTEQAHWADRVNERMRKRIGADRLVPPGSGRDRGREHADVVDADMWDPPVRRRGRARGLAGLVWA
jgi:hypothetical protein